jgi:precorrin-6B methylase 2
MWVKCSNDQYVNVDQLSDLYVTQDGSSWDVGDGTRAIASYPTEAAAVAAIESLINATDLTQLA